MAKRNETVIINSKKLNRDDPKAVKRLGKQIATIRALIESARVAEFAVWQVLLEAEIEGTWQIAGLKTYKKFAKSEFGLSLDGKYADYCTARKNISHDDLATIGTVAVRQFVAIVQANKNINGSVIKKFYKCILRYYKIDLGETGRHVRTAKHVRSAADDVGLRTPVPSGTSWKARAEQMESVLRAVVQHAQQKSSYRTIEDIARVGLQSVGCTAPREKTAKAA